MEEIELKDARVIFEPNFISPAEADHLFSTMLETTDWQEHQFNIFGRQYAMPRLTAWFAESDVTYQYAGIRLSPNPWTENLKVIKKKLEERFHAEFNSVLLNRYRSGQDSVDWHADDEIELGSNPEIGSVSLGATRRFVLKRRSEPHETYTLNLNHGSALFMGGTTQHFWRHKIPKTRKPVGERLNLTFRKIKNLEV